MHEKYGTYNAIDPPDMQKKGPDARTLPLDHNWIKKLLEMKKVSESWDVKTKYQGFVKHDLFALPDNQVDLVVCGWAVWTDQGSHGWL